MTRLIDAEALAKAIMIAGNPFGKSTIEVESCKNVLKIIDHAPTVCGNNPKWCESCVSKGKCASTRPQGDLISREALKEHKFLSPQVKVIGGRRCGKTREQIIEAYQKGWNDCIDAIIDNAPTVEPQNKWGKWVISEIRCPNCLEYFDTDCYSTEELNKCPNCGANMRGGAES